MKIRLAAPSCVYPDRLGPNCHALAPKVREVALMLLETQSCLEYDHRDLPPNLPDLGLSYHAHLPLDLPWNLGPCSVGIQIQALDVKIAFLHPWGYVLHPPDPEALEELVQIYPKLGGKLLLENTRESDLDAVWPVILRHNLGVCLDIGHLLSYGQQAMLQYPNFFAQVRMLHVYGGESPTGHAGLDTLPRPEWLRNVLFQMKQDCVAVVELFQPSALEHSLSLLRSWLTQWGITHD